MSRQQAAAVLKGSYAVRRAGRQAAEVLPEHICHATAGQVSKELLSAVNRGAGALIVDLTATISCDYPGADALLRARQRAVANGTEMRPAVTDGILRRAQPELTRTSTRNCLATGRFADPGRPAGSATRPRDRLRAGDHAPASRNGGTAGRGTQGGGAVPRRGSQHPGATLRRPSSPSPPSGTSPEPAATLASLARPRLEERGSTRPGSGRLDDRQLVPRRSQPAAALESSREVAGSPRPLARPSTP
jgi:anti-anti-sigma regulatory factor